MAASHISVADLPEGFAALLSRVRAGERIVIDDGAECVAVLQSAGAPMRTLEECMALLNARSTHVMDEDFARDVEEGIRSRRDGVDSSLWG